MNPHDEKIRATVNDALAAASIDVRTTLLDCAVGVRDVAPSDSADGRGRSPVTGTSADSAHESRHQLDPD